MNQIILSSAYLAPVGYYSLLSGFDRVFIEQFDSYHKQTYRNRCRILAANGPHDLIIPVVKESGRKIIMRDTKIDYATRWQQIHWRSLFSSYNSSPFFEYYSEYFYPYYQKRWDFLFDYNLELMKLIMDLLQRHKNIMPTVQFQKKHEGAVDFRDDFSPKKRQNNMWRSEVILQPYTQTFSEKFGFVPGLSIIDLLFNCGPASETILLQYIVEK